MAQWISLSEAAYNYGVSEEDILFWIEKREIAFVPVGTTYVVDDESIWELLSQHQVIPTKEYIASLKQLYENEFFISQSYQDIISSKELEIINLTKQIDLMQKIQDALDRNNKAREKINILLRESAFVKMGWCTEMRRRLCSIHSSNVLFSIFQRKKKE